MAEQIRSWTTTTYEGSVVDVGADSEHFVQVVDGGGGFVTLKAVTTDQKGNIEATGAITLPVTVAIDCVSVAADLLRRIVGDSA